MTAALRVGSLSVELARRRVLDDVSLSIHAGEFVAVLGPNGAGKTTLLRAVLDLVPRAAGEIAINGARPSRVRSAVGYVPQRHEFAWDFPITVEDAVMTGRTAHHGLFRRVRGDDLRAAGSAIDRVGLGPLRRRPVGQLSGGQRQRVLVARALSHAPSVLLLDEPFTGLDMPAQEELTDLFGHLASEGHAVVMTTHDLATAVDQCSRLILLNRTIHADAAPQDLTSPEPWISTFRVRPDNPMLRVVTAARGARVTEAVATC